MVLEKKTTTQGFSGPEQLPETDTVAASAWLAPCSLQLCIFKLYISPGFAENILLGICLPTKIPLPHLASPDPNSPPSTPPFHLPVIPWPPMCPYPLPYSILVRSSQSSLHSLPFLTSSLHLLQERGSSLGDPV